MVVGVMGIIVMVAVFGVVLFDFMSRTHSVNE